MNRILLSMVTIFAAVAIVAGVTIAFFSDTESVPGNVLGTGTVTIGETRGLPFTISNLYPGLEYTTGVLRVRYDGTVPADLYFGTQQQKSDGSYKQEVIFSEVLEFKLERMKSEGGVWVHDGWIIGNETTYASIGLPFMSWQQIGTSLAGGQWTNVRLHLRMLNNNDIPEPFSHVFPVSIYQSLVEDWEATNWDDYQGKEAEITIFFYAVQEGGATPEAKPSMY